MECRARFRRPTAVLFLLTGLLNPLNAVAGEPTTWTVTGRVTDAATASPLPDALVVAADREARTNSNGEFRLDLPASAATIEVVLADFATKQVAVDASAGEARADVALEHAPRFHEELEVRGDPLGAAASSAPVRPADVTRVAGGAENVFRVLPTLPASRPPTTSAAASPCAAAAPTRT